MNQIWPDLHPRIILGVAAHPDDLEYYASGSLAKWAAAGAKVYYLILTGGGKGTTDPKLSSAELIARRQAEQQAAGRVIGLADIFFADFEDARLKNSLEVKREIIRRIRQVKPDVVVGWDPTAVYSAAAGTINHPDHRAAGQATLDAVYPLARDHLSYPELLAEGLTPHKVRTVLMMRDDSPNFISDISGYLDAKVDALQAHASQFPAGSPALESMKTTATELGRAYDLAAAEGFVRLDLRD